MQWTNEKILEFIENYETEPVLWNPLDPNYKKKQSHYEAWVRVKDNLSWPATIDELKSKMKSLMAYYRTHLNKYIKSLKSGATKDEVYQTNWFAFSAMNSFLGPVYEYQRTLSSQISEENETQIHTEEIHTEEREIEERSNSSVQKKLKKDKPAEIIEAKQQMQEAFQTIKDSFNDEYDIFGKLIAIKIRKLKNPNTREIVMNDIQNIIFRAKMNDQHEQSTSQSPEHVIYLPSPNSSTSE